MGACLSHCCGALLHKCCRCECKGPGNCCSCQCHAANEYRPASDKRNISAVFQISEPNTVVSDSNLININIATEEELMTLPGINRNIAHSIIDYRNKVGQFRKIEDLALAPGVGANKLNSIRSEICVSNHQSSNIVLHLDNFSQLSRNLSSRSCNSKGISWRSRSERTNINTANVFQLSALRGLGQTLAENIVMHRDMKRNGFQSIDELVKVKGINKIILSDLRPYLCISDDRSDHTSDSVDLVSLASKDSSEVKFRRFLNLLTDNSDRPNRMGFNFERNGRPAFRIASWNIERCTLDKVENPGVLEVVCLTLLESGFSIVAVQELAHSEALQKICDELNCPNSRKVLAWPAHRGKWKCVVSDVAGRQYQSVEYNGFLYDSSRGVELLESGLLEAADQRKQFARQPFMAFFRVGTFDFVVISVHLKAINFNGDGAEKLVQEISYIPSVMEAVQDQLPVERDVLFVGDFNMPPDSEEFKVFSQHNYMNVIPDNCFSNISIKNPHGSKLYDHIWLYKDTSRMFTGRAGVVRDGLTHMAIPNGWSWGGLASDHCPVWAEFYSSSSPEQIF